MPVRPARFRAALTGLALATVVTGCAGTDPGAAPGSSSSGSASSSASSPATSAPATSATAEAPAGQRIEVTVTGGQVSGDTGRVPVPAGEHVVLVVTSDAPDELHVHGYDLSADLVPGTPATVEFDATIPGVFEVELHDAGMQLLSLQVS